jgi:hypothetical protein
LFDAAHRLATSADLVLASGGAQPCEFVGVRGAVPRNLFELGDEASPADSRLRVARIAMPAPIRSASDLARALFDARADLATRQLSPDDVPVHTLEVISSMGLELAVTRGDAVKLRRAAGGRGAPLS